MNAAKTMAACACCAFAYATFAGGCAPAADANNGKKPEAKASTPAAQGDAVFKDGWTEDYKGALRTAKSKNLPLFLDFTGSDWCGWCMLMDRKVFDQKEWKKWAADNLVCVKLDFPSRIRQSDALKAQNKALMQRFGVQGFPTFVVLSPDGDKELARLNCPGRGVTAERFVEMAKKAVGK